MKTKKQIGIALILILFTCLSNCSKDEETQGSSCELNRVQVDKIQCVLKEKIIDSERTREYVHNEETGFIENVKYWYQEGLAKEEKYEYDEVGNLIFFSENFYLEEELIGRRKTEYFYNENQEITNTNYLKSTFDQVDELILNRIDEYSYENIGNTIEVTLVSQAIFEMDTLPNPNTETKYTLDENYNIIERAFYLAGELDGVYLTYDFDNKENPIKTPFKYFFKSNNNIITTRSHNPIDMQISTTQIDYTYNDSELPVEEKGVNDFGNTYVVQYVYDCE